MLERVPELPTNKNIVSSCYTAVCCIIKPTSFFLNWPAWSTQIPILFKLTQVLMFSPASVIQDAEITHQRSGHGSGCSPPSSLKRTPENVVKELSVVSQQNKLPFKKKAWDKPVDCCLSQFLRWALGLKHGENCTSFLLCWVGGALESKSTPPSAAIATGTDFVRGGVDHFSTDLVDAVGQIVHWASKQYTASFHPPTRFITVKRKKAYGSIQMILT